MEPSEPEAPSPSAEVNTFTVLLNLMSCIVDLHSVLVEIIKQTPDATLRKALATKVKELEPDLREAVDNIRQLGTKGLSTKNDGS